jgi:hypothetical protein
MTRGIHRDYGSPWTPLIPSKVIPWEPWSTFEGLVGVHFFEMSLVYRYSVVWFTYPHIKSSKYISFLIVGKEICPKTKKLHWQGYLETLIRLSFRRMKTILGPTAHIETARKGALANVRYCTKGNDISHYIGNAADPIVSAWMSSFIQTSNKLKIYLTKLRQDAQDSPKKLQVQEASQDCSQEEKRKEEKILL